MIDKSIQAFLIWKVNVSEEFHWDPYPWSMVMQMEDKRLYNDTKYSGLRPSRHVYWRTRKTVKKLKLSIWKKWITPQSFSHNNTKGKENNKLNASANKALWILFDQFSQCLSAQNDEYSTDHIIPNWCKFPQLFSIVLHWYNAQVKLKIFDELNFERIPEQISDLSLPSKSTSKYFELGQFGIGFWLKEGDTYY